jgi:hypothetical protein
MTTKLAAMAAQMRAAIALKPFGWTNQKLSGGLDIVLSRNGEKWRLALRREKVFPSEIEARWLAQAFGIAEDTEPMRRKFCEVHPSSERLIEWHIIEYNWREVDTNATCATTA